MGKPRCETCRFWESAEPAADESTDGWCHRHPPIPFHFPGAREMGQASYSPVFPLTAFDDWCGEWAAVRATEGNPEEKGR
jgi:hypothetical protein